MRREISGLVVWVLLCAASAAADEFDLRLEEAKANEASPEWIDYQGPFFEKLVPVLQPTMQSCFPKDQESAIGKFTLLFAIQADGSLSSFLVRPESERTGCVVAGVRGVEVPRPPRPNWWGFLEIRVEP